jgi:hypothetical protein
MTPEPSASRAEQASSLVPHMLMALLEAHARLAKVKHRDLT